MSALHGPVVDGAPHCAPGETAEQGPEVPACGAHAPAETETGRGTAREARAPPPWDPLGNQSPSQTQMGARSLRGGRGGALWPGACSSSGVAAGPCPGGGRPHLPQEAEGLKSWPRKPVSSRWQAKEDPCTRGHGLGVGPRPKAELPGLRGPVPPPPPWWALESDTIIHSVHHNYHR